MVLETVPERTGTVAARTGAFASDIVVMEGR